MNFRPSILILIGWLLFGGLLLGRPGADTKTPNVPTTDSLRVVRFELLGLKESRAETAERALLQLPGVKELKIDTNRKQVVVTFDVEQTNLKKIRDCLKGQSLTPIL